MSAEIITLTGADLRPGPFMDRWIYGNHPYERSNTKRASSIADKKHARVHVLAVGGHDYGFVAVDIHKLQKNKKDKQHYIQIAYLFVSKPHRKKRIPELDNFAVTEYLMGHVIAESFSIAKFLPVKELILDPASPRLETYYDEVFGFKRIPGLSKNSPKFMSMHLNWFDVQPAEAA